MWKQSTQRVSEGWKRQGREISLCFTMKTLPFLLNRMITSTIILRAKYKKIGVITEHEKPSLNTVNTVYEREGREGTGQN